MDPVPWKSGDASFGSFLGCWLGRLWRCRWTRDSVRKFHQQPQIRSISWCCKLSCKLLFWEAYEAPEELLGISLGEPNGYTAQLGALVGFRCGKTNGQGGKQQPSMYVEILGRHHNYKTRCFAAYNVIEFCVIWYPYSLMDKMIHQLGGFNTT